MLYEVITIVILSLTGVYIGAPFIAGGDGAFVMGWVRMVHFVTAYVFTVSVLVRICWMFAGNHHASWRAFMPWLTETGRKNFIKMFRYYTFTGKQISYEVGHNPVITSYSIHYTKLYERHKWSSGAEQRGFCR